MRNFESPVLRAGTRLSAFSVHLVRLLQRLTRRLSLEERSSNSDSKRRVRADLLSALALQKQVVEEHSTLVRSMLRRQGLQKHLNAAQSTDGVGLRGGRQYSKLSDHAVTGPIKDLGQAESLGVPFTERQRQIIQLVAQEYDNRQIAQSLSISGANCQEPSAHDL